MGRLAVPAADCLPLTTETQCPERHICRATVRPARMGRNVSVAVESLSGINVAGIDRDAVCATTLSFLVEVTCWARTVPAILTRGARVRIVNNNLDAGARNLVA